MESNEKFKLEELWHEEKLGIMVRSKHEIDMIPKGAFLNRFGLDLKEFLFAVAKINNYALVVTREDGYFMMHGMKYADVDFIITVDEILDGVTKPISVTQEELDSILNA